MKKGKIFVISGPSGSGKTTLHDMLLKDKDVKRDLKVTISATTRMPRKGEKHGRDYFFLSEKMFLYKIRTGQFLEYAKVFNNLYGTLNSQVEEIWQQGKHVLLSIDVQGCRQICQKHPDAVTIFIKTPSFKVLKERLDRRNTDDAESIALRLKIARQEIKDAKNYKYIIINEDLQKAYLELKSIILDQIHPT
jgi:guanylate kinase